MYLWFLLVFFFQSCFWSYKISDNANLHLTIDTERSYPRFCIYEITKKDGKCQAEFLPKSPYNCRFIPTDNHLGYMDQNDALNAIVRGISEINLSYPDIRKKITSLSFAGLDLMELDKKKSSELLSKIDSFITKNNANLQYTSKITSPDEEVSLLYHFMDTESQNQTPVFLNLSNYTYSIGFFDTSKNKSVTYLEKEGVTGSYTKNKSEIIDTKTCFQIPSNYFTRPENKNPFEDCRNYVQKKIFSKSKLSSTIKQLSNNSVKYYAVGQGWDITFQLLKKDFIQKTDLEDLGNKTCKLTILELIRTGIQKSNAEKICFTLAMQVGLLDSLNVTEVHRSKIPIHKAIASSPLFFKDCE